MNFEEQNTQPYDWETQGVYVIANDDYVEGGEDGVSNRQAKELTKRTRNLHKRMTTAQGEIDALQRDTPIKVEAALRTAKEYTNSKDSTLRGDMATADTATLRTAKDYADKIVSALVDNSPEALNTLQELAKALGNDPNFATTVMQQIGERMKTTDVNNALAGKFDKTGGDINGSISMQYPDGLGGRWVKQIIAGTDSVGLHMNRAVAAGRVSQLDVYTRGDDGFAKRLEIGREILRFQGKDLYHTGNLNLAEYQNQKSGQFNFSTVTSWNEINKSGVWRIDAWRSDNNHGAGIFDKQAAPPMLHWQAILKVVEAGSSYADVMQEVIFKGGGRCWRIYYNNEWSPWVTSYTTGNLGPATTTVNGLMTKEDKTKLNALSSAVLGGGRVDLNGTNVTGGIWGKATRVVKLEGYSGRYRIYHTINSQSYEVMGNVIHGQGFIGMVMPTATKTTTYIDVTVNDVLSNERAGGFTFQLFGYLG